MQPKKYSFVAFSKPLSAFQDFICHKQYKLFVKRFLIDPMLMYAKTRGVLSKLVVLYIMLSRK